MRLFQGRTASLERLKALLDKGCSDFLPNRSTVPWSFAKLREFCVPVNPRTRVSSLFFLFLLIKRNYGTAGTVGTPLAR